VPSSNVPSKPAGSEPAAEHAAHFAQPARPRLRVLAGPNGSGKSTIQTELKPEWLGVFINADEIERALKQSAGELNLAALGFRTSPEAALRGLEQHIQSSSFAEKLGLHSLLGHMSVDEALTLRLPGPFNSYVASVLADAIRRELLEEGQTFTFETVMSSRDKVDFMREARARGYRVYLYFVATDDPDINLDRVQRRVLQGGHPVPEDKVRKRYRESIDLMTEACDVAHRAYIFDNSGSRHKLLVELEELSDGDAITLHTSRLNHWFVETQLWRSFA
jgi:predicted ABC-type ATPase